MEGQVTSPRGVRPGRNRTPITKLVPSKDGRQMSDAERSDPVIEPRAAAGPAGRRGLNATGVTGHSGWAGRP